jgi:hypothetical protein
MNNPLRYYGDHFRAIMALAHRRANGEHMPDPQNAYEWCLNNAVASIEGMDALKRKALSEKIQASEASVEEKEFLTKKCDL